MSHTIPDKSKPNVNAKNVQIKNTKGLITVANLNTRSLRNPDHFIQFVEFLSSECVDIACVTETWLRDHHGLLQIPGYCVTRHDRPSHAGGVAIIHRKDINCSVIRTSNPDIDECEYVAVKLKVKNYAKLYLCAFYRPNNVIRYRETKKCLSEIASLNISNSKFILAGDFNFDVLHLKDCSHPILDYLNTKNFNQIVHLPTRKDATLDHVYVNGDFTSNVRTTQPGICDHDAVLFNLNMRRPKCAKVCYEYRDFDRIDFESLIMECTESDLTINSDNPSEEWGKWALWFQNLLDKYAPLIKKHHFMYSGKRFISDRTKHLKLIRDIAHRNTRKYSNPYWSELYNSINKEIKRSIRSESRHYLNSIISKQGFWKGIKNWIPTKKSSNKEPRISDVDQVNHHFAHMTGSNYPLLPDEYINYNFDRLYDLSIHIINKHDLVRAYKELKGSARTRADECGIVPKFLSLLLPIPCVCESLVSLFNLCTRVNCIPECFKSVVITPLLKKQNLSDSDLNNMRAIATIPFVGKLFERIIYNQLSSHLNRINFFSPHQFGFRRGHSTEHLLIKITDKAFKAVDEGKVCLIATIDMRKAFPLVSRNLLLVKLAEAGINPGFFKNYLANRTQCIRTRDGRTSSIIQNEWGVPEGSVNGPLLFSIFINKLPEQTKFVDSDLFVDDTTLVIECYPKDIQETVNKIENDIVACQNWLNMNHIDLNHEKTEFMIVGSTHNVAKCGNVSIVVSGHSILPSDSIRVLGFVLDKHMMFDQHIMKVKRNCNMNLSPLYQLRPMLDDCNMVLLVKSMIFSHLNYMICIWGSAKKSLIKQVEGITRAAARLVLCKGKYDSISDDICNVLKWLSIRNLEKKSVLCHMFKILKGRLHPDFLINYFEECGLNHNFNTRGSNQLRQNVFRKEIYRRSFRYRGSQYWNACQHKSDLNIHIFSTNITRALLRTQLH